jgi:hypothetical protein
LTPWLAGVVLIGGIVALLGLSGAQPSLAQRGAMILALCGSLAVAGMLAARSSRESHVVAAQERDRPAQHELSGIEGADPAVYVENMRRWTDAMLELVDHAAATPAGQEAEAAAELTAAASDTRDLRDLLDANTDVPLRLGGLVTLRSICAMWEVDRARIERLAARIDLDWYRRWRARSVVERLVCRGVRTPATTVLPYRS